MYECLHVCKYVSMYAWMLYVSAHLWMSVCMYVCMYGSRGLLSYYCMTIRPHTLPIRGGCGKGRCSQYNLMVGGGIYPNFFPHFCSPGQKKINQDILDEILRFVPRVPPPSLKGG